MSIDATATVLHYVLPGVLFLGYVAIMAKQSMRVKPRKHLHSEKGRYLATVWCFIFLNLTYFAAAGTIIARAFIQRGWFASQDQIIYIISVVFVNSLIILSTVDGGGDPSGPSLAHTFAWLWTLVASVVLLTLALVSNSSPKSWDALQLAIDAFRLCVLCVSPTILLCLRSGAKDAAESESEPLIAQQQSYGATDANQEAADVQQKETSGKPSPDTSWFAYAKSFTILFPYLWPSKDRRLQVLMLISFGIMLLQRVLNLCVPIQIGRVTDGLSGDATGSPYVPWTGIVLYVFLKFSQGGMGILSAARNLVWLPVEQFCYRSLAQSAFEHVHSLSLDFHLSKKVGEVISALDKGSSINNFVEQVLMTLIPMVVDLLFAIGYFLVAFDAYYALIVLIVTITYIWATIKLTQWRMELRRDMVNKSREEYAVKADSLTAYEVVKYFNAEEYEFNRYRNAVTTFQAAEFKNYFALETMNITQNFIFTFALLCAALLSAYQASIGQSTVGHFVVLLTYFAQLQGPLSYIGSYIRSTQSSMVNAERMLELFKYQPTVKDKPDAKALDVQDGLVEFNDVQFAYDVRKPALRGISFKVPAGSTIAFAGESGSGKTTILRLLFRLYDVGEGSIRIDGQDVRDVTSHSLRQSIGVVAQESVLFNESLMYNLRYARPECTDEEVYEACRAASIHDRVMTFPDQYETKVGERGLRLSGGEKQRVAIARTIIKNPRITILDEATSSLDTSTERNIQAALRNLSVGRTTLMIAHRLSTITHADLICVVSDGRIVERGSHAELLQQGNLYYSMWEKQIQAEAPAEDFEKDNESSDGTDPGSTKAVASA